MFDFADRDIGLRANTVDEILDVMMAYKAGLPVECRLRVGGTGWFREREGGGKHEWDFARYFYRRHALALNN